MIHEEHPDIVVMGTHGRGIIGRLLMGSVTQQVLRHLEVPVLSVSHVDGFRLSIGFYSLPT